jgi:hypothetical protein
MFHHGFVELRLLQLPYILVPNILQCDIPLIHWNSFRGLYSIHLIKSNDKYHFICLFHRLLHWLYLIWFQTRIMV